MILHLSGRQNSGEYEAANSMAGDSGFHNSGPETLAGALLYAAIGLAIASYGGYDVQQTDAVRELLQINVTITELSIETDSGTSSNPRVEYELIVEFEYTYNGTQYTGTKLYPATIEQNYETR